MRTRAGVLNHRRAHTGEAAGVENGEDKAPLDLVAKRVETGGLKSPVTPRFSEPRRPASQKGWLFALHGCLRPVKVFHRCSLRRLSDDAMPNLGPAPGSRLLRGLHADLHLRLTFGHGNRTSNVGSGGAA